MDGDSPSVAVTKDRGLDTPALEEAGATSPGTS